MQDRDKVNLQVRLGSVIREFPLRKGYGFADYLLYVAVGVVEAKKKGRYSERRGTSIREIQCWSPGNRSNYQASASFSLSKYRC